MSSTAAKPRPRHAARLPLTNCAASGLSPLHLACRSLTEPPKARRQPAGVYLLLLLLLVPLFLLPRPETSAVITTDTACCYRRRRRCHRQVSVPVPNRSRPSSTRPQIPTRQGQPCRPHRASVASPSAATIGHAPLDGSFPSREHLGAVRAVRYLVVVDPPSAAALVPRGQLCRPLCGRRCRGKISH